MPHAWAGGSGRSPGRHRETLMEDMWKYMAGGALVGVLGMIAGFWGKVKGVLWRLANLFVQQVEIPTEEAHNALVAYLIAHHKRSRMYDRMYGAWYAHRRDGRYEIGRAS